ncbi:hypothetical protein Q8F57_009635 [Paraburkholderia terrae]|uniref:hypothetical protein n=1 Tax=Paraburkholderia terrae TaxID=311230 RepID=UPI00296AA39E|nr:hypothetical protein [Paraburkholderia terrae]MDW3662554.1 hypothetical protein [Paraburkholderia terrae]
MKQVYKDLENQHLYRVVMTGFGQPLTYLMPLDGKRLAIRCMKTEEFAQLVGENETATGGFVLIKEDPFKAKRSRQRCTPRHNSQTNDSWNLIKDLVKLDSKEGISQFITLLKTGPKRREILEQRARQADVDRRTVYTYFRLYLQRGMVPSAVYSGYPNSGIQAKGQGRSRVYREAPGPKPKGSKPEIMLPSELRDRVMEFFAIRLRTDKQAIWDVDLPEDIESQLAEHRGDVQESGRSEKSGKRKNSNTNRKRTQRAGRRARATVRNALLRMNYLLRCKREVRDAQGRVIEVHLRDFDAITVGIFRYFLRNRDAWERRRRSMGEGKFAAQGRARKGHALEHCHGPGHVFMIDATVADIFLVSCLDVTVVVGRPTIYFVVDVWSRMIVGLHVSFRRPSFEGAALAMISAVTPKSQFCADYGFVITSEEWPCEYISAKIHSDRGCEYLQAVPWQIMSARFGVGIDNSAAYEPFWRGIAERRFGIIPVIAQRNGYAVVEKPGDALRGANPAIDALWTRAQFVRELLRAIYLYHREPISGTIDAPPGMVSSGMANSPLNRWNWGIKNNLAILQACDVDEMTHAVLVPEKATITSGGLRLDGIGYGSKHILSEYVPMHDNARKGQVDVRYNPDRLGQLSMNSADEIPEFVKLSGTNALDLTNVTQPEWNLYRQMDKSNAATARLANEPQEMVMALNSAEDRRKEVEQQKAALKAKGKTHPDAKHIKEAKAHEEKVERTLRGQSSGKSSVTGEQPENGSSAIPQRPVSNSFKSLMNHGALGLLRKTERKSKARNRRG